MANKITISRGTTVTISGTVTDGGDAVDITGATIFFTVKSAEYSTDATDTDALVSKDVTSLSDPTNGGYTVTLNPSDTATVTPGNYYYDLKIRYADGTIYKLDEGRFVLDGSPTNRLS